jgi:hypothetical protein
MGCLFGGISIKHDTYFLDFKMRGDQLFTIKRKQLVITALENLVLKVLTYEDELRAKSKSQYIAWL